MRRGEAQAASRQAIVAEVEPARRLVGVAGQRAVLHPVHRGQPRQPFVGLAPGGVTHAERLEHVLAHVVGEGLARQRLDEQRLHVDRDAVAPARAGVEQQRHLREALAHLRQVVVEPERVGLDVGVVGGCVARAVGEAGRMAHDVAHGDRTRRRAIDRLAAGVLPGVDLHRLERRQVARQRIVEAELALFPQLHQRHAGDRLGHRVDLRDGVARHRLLRLAVGVAARREDGLAAVLPDQQRHAGRAAVRHHGRQRLVDPGRVDRQRWQRRRRLCRQRRAGAEQADGQERRRPGETARGS